MTESLPAALYCFLHNPDDFAAGGALAIAAGHDTDITVAFVGAMYNHLAWADAPA